MTHPSTCRDNKPSSNNTKKVIAEFERAGATGQQWTDIMTAVNTVAAAAGVRNLTDSEKAEVLYYLGGKIQGCWVI